ncbi:MAG: hypothetical protein MZV64_28260 [Ignavibacteriales bacterium]|nr:hypothetical protein [Ignavibacteriales bacterium]
MQMLSLTATGTAGQRPGAAAVGQAVEGRRRGGATAASSTASMAPRSRFRGRDARERAPGRWRWRWWRRRRMPRCRAPAEPGMRLAHPMTFGTRTSRGAPVASGAFASAVAGVERRRWPRPGRSRTGARSSPCAGRRRVERGCRDPVHERENLGELRLVEGGFGRRELEAGKRRDAGNREVLALGGHGRC